MTYVISAIDCKIPEQSNELEKSSTLAMPMQIRK